MAYIKIGIFFFLSDFLDVYLSESVDRVTLVLDKLRSASVGVLILAVT
jgi:hypothetical protein